jgi:DNA-binding beta-propeller fold protein YncE
VIKAAIPKPAAIFCGLALLAPAPALVTWPSPAIASTGFGLLSGPGGCLADPEHKTHEWASCGAGPALAENNALVASPDGKNVYVVSGNAGTSIASSFGSLAILKREPATGAITEVGCMSSDGTDGRDGAAGACTAMPSLLDADGVAVSPDGSMVFVTAGFSGSVIAFARNPETGFLTRLGCYQFRPPLGSPCATANVFLGSDEVVAGAGGNALYVASPTQGSLSALTAPLPDTPAGAVAGSSGLASLFGVIDPRRGLENPCIAVNGFDGSCAVGVATQGLDGLQLSPDGKELYGVAAGSHAIDGFAVTGEGAPAETTCLKNSPPPGPCTASRLIHEPKRLAVAPDGRNLYASDEGESGGQLDVLTRNQATGAASESSCIDRLPEPKSREEEKEEEENEEKQEEEPHGPDLCTSVPGLESVDAVAVSGDGSAVYAIGGGSANVFSRDAATGRLTEVSCASNSDKRCTSLPSFAVSDAIVSPDGREVYVAAHNAVLVFGVGSTIATATASATRSGRVRLQLDCPSRLRRPCSGHVVLMRTVARRAAYRDHRIRRISRIIVGRSAHFRISPGHRAVLTARLSRYGRQLLLRRGRLRLTTVMRADPAGGGSGYGRHLALRLAPRRGAP